MPVKGVDISEMNNYVDFNNLKQAGIEFVLIRCGYGGDYTYQDDEYWEINIKNAEACGMPWGAYLYSYAKNNEMAQSEARHTLRLLAGRKPPYGVWYDVEDKQQADCDLVSICETYCKIMEAEGLYCGIYSGLYWFEEKLNNPRLDRFDKWVAQWNDVCQYKKPYGIWQFTDKFYIGQKRFDADWAYKDYPSITQGKKEENFLGSKSRVFNQQDNSITRPFGNGHGGIDLAWDTNPETPVTAHSDGIVVFCQSGYSNNPGSSGNASYGNCVKIRHNTGWSTLYAHLSSIKVKSGDVVKKGQEIGNMGNTGNSYGNHLHFEVRNSNDDRVDPFPYLAADLPGIPTKNNESEDDDMDVKRFTELFREMRKDLQDNDNSEWSKEGRDFCVKNGLITGAGTLQNGEPNYAWQDLLTREQMAVLLYRFAKMMEEE